ncbi:MAG: RHS repeat-associated core domain-containing protein, partial [Candidatus Omnitrophica bacterium]|nr:RHS repeat-associated core domain-containing protein [Candidatus Omnitrophota bacterium]
GALSERIEHGAYSGGSHPIVSWRRYEYHGLDLVRVDERYDTGGGAIDSNDPWRTLEVSSHRPGAIGSLLGKRVYTHTNNDATPDVVDDFYYTYDPVGNVVSVLDDSGNEAHHFTQEAFGNQLPVNVLGGSDWNDAADDRIVEHQTGKWKDECTGLYYFWARWYDPEVGRFVSRDRQDILGGNIYSLCYNSPSNLFDPDGRKPKVGRTTGNCEKAIPAVIDWIDKGAKKCCLRCWKQLDGTTVEAFTGSCKMIEVGRTPEPPHLPIYVRQCEGDAFLKSVGPHIEGWTSLTGGLMWIKTRNCMNPINLVMTFIHEMFHACDPILAKDLWREFLGYGKAETGTLACLRKENNGQWPKIGS